MFNEVTYLSTYNWYNVLVKESLLFSEMQIVNHKTTKNMSYYKQKISNSIVSRT